MLERSRFRPACSSPYRNMPRSGSFSASFTSAGNRSAPLRRQALGTYERNVKRIGTPSSIYSTGFRSGTASGQRDALANV